MNHVQIVALFSNYRNHMSKNNTKKDYNTLKRFSKSFLNMEVSHEHSLDKKNGAL